MTCLLYWDLATKKGRDRVKKYQLRQQDGEIRSNLVEKRLTTAKEKGFCPGCSIRYIGKDIVCMLKRVSEDGFLIIVGSKNRENPKFWEVVQKQNEEG